jgi:hypothetical protein
MDAVCSSETFVTTYQTIRCHNSEERITVPRREHAPSFLCIYFWVSVPSGVEARVRSVRIERYVYRAARPLKDFVSITGAGPTF